MKLVLSSIFLCVVFGAGKSARSQATRITVTRRTPHHSKGYGSRSKNKYGNARKPLGKHSISCDSFSCDSFSCGPTANQIPNAKKVKCSKQGCTFNRCCKVPDLCPPIYNETCPASVYDNPLTRASCYDQSQDECELRPVAHIKSYTIFNNCNNSIVVNGQSIDVEKYNCNSNNGCNMVIAPKETKVFNQTQNIDFFPIGDSQGGSQRLQFAFDADCPSPINKVWLELNQSPARCHIPNSDLPNSQNEAGSSSANGDSGIESCSDPTDLLEFGQSYICFNTNNQRVDCKAQGAVRHHSPGTPHYNFARQSGYSNLNLGVSFENDQGDPYCSGGLLGDPSPVSRAQTQMDTDWCKNNPDLVSQQSARLDQVCGGDIEVCLPYCPKENFRRLLSGWSPSIDTDCNACTLSNRKIGPGHYEPIELNYYAKYLSESSCVWDVKTNKWYQQPPTVTTQADYNAVPKQIARKWNPNALVDGVASASGASMFECWDPAGTGAQGIGWGESCEVDQFTRMKVTLCPEVVKCFDPTE